MKLKKKKLLSVILSGLLTFSFLGCQNTNNTETTKGESNVEVSETKTVVDHEGVEVEVPGEINRIVVGNTWPLASVLSVYLGGAEKIVGLHPASMGAAANGLLKEVYPEILNAKTDFIKDSQINIEELLKLNPDIVIGVGKEDAEAIRKAGIPAVTVSVSNWNYNVLETYDQWISLFDQIFGESEISKKISQYSQEAYDFIQERVSKLTEAEKKKVLILHRYDDKTMTTSGANFFGQYWTDATGSINVGQDIKESGIININMEQVYEWNPDIVIISNFTGAQPEDLYNNAIGGHDWSTISAIQNGQVYKMPLGLYRTFTPGADTPVTLQWFAKTIYPELFEDLDIKQITKDYYKNYYNIDMTDEQIERMYNPPRESATGA